MMILMNDDDNDDTDDGDGDDNDDIFPMVMTMTMAVAVVVVMHACMGVALSWEVLATYLAGSAACVARGLVSRVKLTVRCWLCWLPLE